jgi:hypothetical protein
MEPDLMIRAECSAQNNGVDAEDDDPIVTRTSKDTA